MIGFALATVSVLLAGCAAGSSQEPLYTTVDTPYYDVMLPTSLFSSLAVDYDDSYRLDGDTGEASGSAFPCATRARKSRSVRAVRHVFVRSGPRLPRTVDKGAPSAMARSARVRVAADLPD